MLNIGENILPFRRKFSNLEIALNKEGLNIRNTNARKATHEIGLKSMRPKGGAPDRDRRF